MRLAFAYPPMLVGGRPLDFKEVYSSPRGTTGSEIQILTMAKEMARRSHAVDLFIPMPNEDAWEGVNLIDFDQLGARSKEYDAVCVSLDVNVLRHVSSKPVRVLFQQINDFNYAQPGFDEFCDLYISPSRTHLEMITAKSATDKKKWEVVHNGCYPLEYDTGGERDPGSVVVMSSPDRGLHIVLQEWEPIRKAVPWAHLKIFYYSLQKWLGEWDREYDPSWHVFWRENWKRAAYIREALEVASGVTVMGPVSRDQVRRELEKAEVLAYPCDVIAWTEGFSCATLEGCAAGALPVIAEVDAFPELYSGHVPSVPGPGGKYAAEWRELVIRALKDKAWADEWRRKAREHAKGFDWPSLALRFESILRARKEQKHGT